MRIPNCINPEPVLPLYVTLVTEEPVASESVLMRRPLSLLTMLLFWITMPDTVTSLLIEPWSTVR